MLASASQLIRQFLSTADTANQAELNKTTTQFELLLPRRYIRQRVAEEDNIVLEQIVLRYLYENQHFEAIKPLVTCQRVAAVLDLAITLQINSLV